MQYDAFISHASEDKPHVARPLAEHLVAANLTVWLDDMELTVGDSLRRCIDAGLSESRFGVVILSPSFLAKEWPRKELDALIARDDGQQKVILPVWHNVTKSDVAKHSPLLADKLAATTAGGIPAVANQLIKAIEKEKRVSKRETSAPAQPTPVPADGEKPVLVFHYNRRIGWKIRNVGSLPAMDIVVSERTFEGNWERPVRIPTLAGSEERELHWVSHQNVDVLGARYCNARRCAVLRRVSKRQVRDPCGVRVSRVDGAYDPKTLDCVEKMPKTKIDPGGPFPSRFRQEAGEALFRPVVQPDGEVVVEKIPLTLEVLLHPREDDQVTQSRPHHKKLNPLADSLERFLERRPGVGVFNRQPATHST
ncbi:MAG: toll/interleukin-1 receptor domain-containing protein, partial [bacterium]|nr:toll/interleukin-1 receptor domain-containing protein [bacterium]